MRSERVFVADIIEACEKIATFIEGIDRQRFLDDAKIQSAVLYQFVIIGEAANRLSSELRSRYPEVAWRSTIDMRNYVAHGYFDLILPRVWATASNDVPILRVQVQHIFDTEPPGS